MTDPLKAFQRGVRRKQRADSAYRPLLLDAYKHLREEGARDPYAQLARVAGVSRQAIREYITKEEAK